MENASTHQAEECAGSLAFTTQLTAIFILEFGVIFHSVFIGLVLATTDELVILLLVLVFHQLFEGLGLGARLALIPWPKSRRWLPYALSSFAEGAIVRLRIHCWRILAHVGPREMGIKGCKAPLGPGRVWLTGIPGKRCRGPKSHFMDHAAFLETGEP